VLVALMVKEVLSLLVAKSWVETRKQFSVTHLKTQLKKSGSVMRIVNSVMTILLEIILITAVGATFFLMTPKF
jgi:hypothetical protein